MDFDRPKEERDFIAHVKTTLEEKIAPEYPEWKAENTTPRRLFEILGEAGLLGFRLEKGRITPIPWLQNIHYYRLAAEFDGGLAIASFAVSQLGLQTLHLFGTEEQKASYLVPGVKGKKIFAFANTEPGAGSDASAIKLRAEDKGDHFLVNGAKAYITNGDIADSIIFTAITHKAEEKKHRGISMLMVDGNTKGLVRSRLKKYGWKISHLSTLAFKDVVVPKENMVGEEKRGFYQTMEIFNIGRIGIAALAFGSSLGAYKQAFKHAKKRMAFGKTLFEHGSKRNEFAENITKLQAGWLLTKKAAFLKDSGKEFRFNSSMAKLFTTEEGVAISRWAVETFGARGVLSALPVSEYPMDAQAALVGEGAPEVQKKIIAGHITELLEDL